MAEERPNPGAPAPPLTSAAEWTQPFTEYATETLPSGRVCRIRLLNPTAEIAAGTLPNLILDWVVFGKGWSIGPDDPARAVQAHYQGLLQLAARILVAPRLVLREADEPPANPVLNEIGPEALTPDDLYYLRAVGLYNRLPEVADAPVFPAQPADTTAPAGAAGAALPAE